MKKVLFVATVVKGHIMAFHLPYLEWFKKNGYKVHVAAKNDYENKAECIIPFCDKFHDLPFERSPLRKNNFHAYRDLKHIIDANEYEIIHCHTPMGGAIGRLAARSTRKKGTKVIYTAHGFHFYKGAPLINWLLYYPVEKWLARYTDTLITINKEDYNRALYKKFKAQKIVLVNGVGVNLEKFKPQIESQKVKLRDQYGYKENEFILIYVGELSYSKHQDLLIDVGYRLKDKIPNLKILLVGDGDLEEPYKKQIQHLGIQKHVELLGFRKDIHCLMGLADIAVSASRREGLPVNIMEAMAIGLPLIVTDCRGNRDLVCHKENGLIVDIEDREGFAVAIETVYKSSELRDKFTEHNLCQVKRYEINKILVEMIKIYKL